jgi:spermidine synthase
LDSASAAGSTRLAKIDLFVVSALLLFLELALIRWLPAHVLFLTFFTNTVLLASFLGLSLGCLAARQSRNHLPLSPVWLTIVIAAGSAMEWVRLQLQDILDVGGNKTAPQEVFFGTEVRVSDVASFVVPIELIVGLFFLLTVATMIGVGQFLGRRFAALPNAVEAYVVNIGGSLAGVLLFQLVAWRLPPIWWFGLAAAGLVYALLREGSGRWWAVGFSIAAPLMVLAPSYFPMGVIRAQFPEESWSPYYRINYSASTRTIVVNLLGHQQMVSRKDPFPGYAIPYLLNRDTGQPQFHDICIVGAGSGNDLSRALEWAAPDARIDAVEIDPVIQSLGRRDHLDRPYQDPRVTVHLDDGRNFLRSTGRKYDLVIFALVDSLVLHSGVSNIRLESYLFTREAMSDVRRVLKADGLFVMYNYFRQGWIVSRLAGTLTTAFGQPPVVAVFPYRDSIGAAQTAEGFTIFFEGRRAEVLAGAFRESGPYWIRSKVSPDLSSPNGFRDVLGEDRIRVSPAKVEIPDGLKIAEDAWPFLYLQNPMIPALSWRGMIVIGLLSLGLLWLFGRGLSGTPARLGATMVLLGAGFMLLETKAVVHAALLFGSTWTVNIAVFAAVLVMILLANLWVLKGKPASLRMFYLGLLLTLALNIVVPLDAFLGLPRLLQGIGAGMLLLSPVFCSGVIFAVLFRTAARPEQALAFNTAGAILGGLAESASMLIGFQYLVAMAAVIYGASWVTSLRRTRAAPY